MLGPLFSLTNKWLKHFITVVARVTLRNAQCSYDNDCKTCFKEKFPRKFAQMTAELYSNPCRLCSEKDLLTGAGIC